MINQKHLPVMQLNVTLTSEFMLEMYCLPKTDNSSNINWMLRRIMEQNSSEAGSSS